MREIFIAELSEQRQELGAVGDISLGTIRDLPGAQKIAQRCAMAISQKGMTKEIRMLALRALFDLERTPVSTYDLTIAQAKTLERISYALYRDGATDKLKLYIQSLINYQT